MDVVQGSKTPDLKSGFDLTLQNLTAADLIEGHTGQAIHFTSTRSTYLFRIHAAGDDLPANKHASFTISFWARANYSGQFDKRLFSEGSTTNGDPLLTIGTHSGGSDASVDLYVRQGGEEVAHQRTAGWPLDGLDWHHIVLVQTEQPDGSSIREFHLDGALDANLFNPRPSGKVYNMNITSVGAVLRSTAVAYVDGDVDDLAIWKRALTADEIADLFANGIPDLSPPLEPLKINSFMADYRKVVTGGTVRLTWDVTKDATITIAPGVGDVTAISSFGVGQTNVTVAAPTTFTLTASRGAEPPVQASVSIQTIGSVTAGWRWVEDFEDLNEGPVGGQARWLSGDGAIDVAVQGGTMAIGPTGGDDLTAVDLNSLTVRENSSATLFFRFCYTNLEPELPIDMKVGLTEKAIRFNGDFVNNTGTVLIFSRVVEGPLLMQAIDGPAGPLTDSNFVFEPDTVYNVWLDVTNEPLDSTDRFSVHVAEEGVAGRTTVFNNISSDREPGEVPLLGFPKADINYVLVVADPPSQAFQAIWFDDFFISAPGSFIDTVPIPSGFGKISAQPFAITNVQYVKATGKVSLTWLSAAGATYSIWHSTNLVNWTSVESGISSQGAATTREVSGTYFEPAGYFRVGR